MANTSERPDGQTQAPDQEMEELLAVGRIEENKNRLLGILYRQGFNYVASIMSPGNGTTVLMEREKLTGGGNLNVFTSYETGKSHITCYGTAQKTELKTALEQCGCTIENGSNGELAITEFPSHIPELEAAFPDEEEPSQVRVRLERVWDQVKKTLNIA